MLAVLGDTASERGSQILEWVARKGSWDNLPSAEKNFYSGEWFEVWLAGQIQRIFKLPEDCICVGAKLNRQDVMNHISYEYDVAFILNNTLYTGECKVSSKSLIRMARRSETNYSSMPRSLCSLV
ncbi:MAG: hypothetical protein IPH16_13960 [Haliscomenobacter sp.]|nr:hypothetical protein [Haliscomenobacter sp.]